MSVLVMNVIIASALCVVGLGIVEAVKVFIVEPIKQKKEAKKYFEKVLENR